MRQIDIVGFENYQITDDGRVWSKKNKVYLSLNKKDGNGYPQCVLYKNGKGIPIDIHILVAKAYVPNPEGKPCVDHINTDKTDNKAENLRWCTPKENMGNPLTYAKMKGINIGRKHTDEWKAYMSKNNGRYWLGKHHSEETRKKMSESCKGRIPANRKKILQYTLEGEFVKEWKCIKDACDAGYTLSSIVLCCQGKRKTHKGYIWKYATD